MAESNLRRGGVLFVREDLTVEAANPDATQLLGSESGINIPHEWLDAIRKAINESVAQTLSFEDGVINIIPKDKKAIIFIALKS